MVINDLPKELKFSETFIFADDLKIVAVSGTQREMQTDLTALDRYARENEMLFAIDKCAKLQLRSKNMNLFRKLHSI